MTKRQASQVRAFAVADALRDEILAGKLKPGERLTFPDLCARHAVSVGVLREALVHLVYRGIVQTEANLGFKVLELSHESFDEHVLTRSLVEPRLVQYAVLHGSIAWESGLVAAHHLLERTPMFELSESSPNMAWDEAHALFHIAIVAACDSRRVIEMTERVHDEAAIYRRWSVSNESPRLWQQRSVKEHQSLLDAVLSGDPDLAMRQAQEHIEHSAAAVKLVERGDSPSSAAARARG